MSCQKCERMTVENRINSETIARVAQDNRALRIYIDKLEQELGIKADEFSGAPFHKTSISE